jgi:hypothetical protein
MYDMRMVTRERLGVQYLFDISREQNGAWLSLASTVEEKR